MMNFEDEDFDFAEGFLDEVLPPSRVPPRPAAGSFSGVGGRPDDPGGFSCTPDSVSVSQMFGLPARPAGALPARPAGGLPARPAPPASPDPFADDLMDADLLDACEAAEATPAAADLPTVSAERSGPRDVLQGHGSQSRDIPNARGFGSRDMLGGIDAASRDMRNSFGAGSRDGLDGSVAVETPSRDTSTSGRIPDLGSRDTPVAGAFPGSRSRDTPTSVRRPGEGSRVGGRRSTGSAVKRRFPGPAGILPSTGSLLTLAHEVSLQEDELTVTGEEEDPSLQDAVSESQLSQSEEAAAWQSGPWRHLLAELRLSAADPAGLLRRINMAAIRRAAAANQLRKVPLLAALLHTLEPTSDLSYQATFRDPTGQMDATVAKDAFEHCGAALRPGCVLVLRDVVVWRESARRLYLSVTRRSLVYLFPETPSGGDAAAVVQLSELSAAELASARLVEEAPSVAVLQESPPPSPPRAQLYPTPQMASGGGGGGGRGWRGRGGRSWRGRGGGGSSGGRPAPYIPRPGGSGGGGSGSGGSPAYRTPAAASPALRGAATASPALRTSAATASPALRTSAATASPALRTSAVRAAAAPRPADGRPASSSPLVSGPGDGPRAAQAASPALRPHPRATAPAPTPTPAPAPAPARQSHPAAVPRPSSSAPTKHKPDTISAAEIDAMFDDDDDVLFGQL